MKKLLSLSVISLLVGCATSGTQMQADCEEKYKDFTEIYQCTYDSIVAKNPKILKDPMAKLSSVSIVCSASLATSLNLLVTTGMSAALLTSASIIRR
jgi:hypothetical protein